VCIVFVLLATFWPIGPDYFFTFRPITESFTRRETRLYDSNSVGYYNAPWSILVLLPTIMLPLRYGQSLLLVVSLLGLLTSVFALMVKGNGKFNLLIVTLALGNLHTFDLLIRGNIDGILVLGIGLGWLGVMRKSPLLLSIGLWLLSMKPINIILTIPVFVKAIWHWSSRDKLLTVCPLAVTFVLSFFIFGFNWPIRYISAISKNPPLTYLQTSLWRAFAFFGLHRELALWLFLMVVVVFGVAISRVKSVNRITLALALSMNLVFSPYTLGSHYILLAPAFAVVAQESKLLIATYFLTLTPLARLFWGFEIAWLDIIYPIALMFGAGYVILRNRERANNGM
jgi:hypothetical protein